MPHWKGLLADRRLQVGSVVAGGVLLALLGWFLHASALPPAAPPTTQPAATPAAPAPGAEAAAAAEPPPEPPKTTARITFTTSPLTNATVSWGKKRLGVITPTAALVIERPRDSGPLDVIVRAAGYLPVTTRANTFADTRIVVKLTRPDQKNTLVGYKAPIDGGMEGTAPEAISAPPFP